MGDIIPCYTYILFLIDASILQTAQPNTKVCNTQNIRRFVIFVPFFLRKKQTIL